MPITRLWFKVQSKFYFWISGTLSLCFRSSVALLVRDKSSNKEGQGWRLALLVGVRWREAQHESEKQYGAGGFFIFLPFFKKLMWNDNNRKCTFSHCFQTFDELSIWQLISPLVMIIFKNFLFLDLNISKSLFFLAFSWTPAIQILDF